MRPPQHFQEGQEEHEALGCVGSWKVELDIRDLGGHLDFTRRARAGTLFKRVKNATHGVVAIGALPLGFQVKLGLVRGEYLPAGLLAVEASYVSASSLSQFRAAIVRSVCFSKLPLQVPWLSLICWMSSWSGPAF